jgi:hypothetical protein
MKLTITPFHFEELIKKSYSLDQIYLLKLLEQEFDVIPLCNSSVKISAIYQSLIRKGLISSEDKLTTEGKELLLFIDSKATSKLIRRKPATTEFTEWWSSYPGTDIFTHSGVKFSGGRSLRQGKDDCRLKFDAIINEGEYTAKQLTDALKFEVLQKKQESVKQRTNKLTYMQNSLTYLNQKSFEPFIDLIDSGEELKESISVTGSTDI